MTVFAVSFRIADHRTDLGDRDTRYKTTVKAVLGTCSGVYWDETTSFILLQSKETSSEAIRLAVDKNSLFDPASDTMVVINLSQKGFSHFGLIEDDHLFSIMDSR